VSFESNRVLRALRLFWFALGPKRFYVAAAIGVILLLALIGLWHLISPATKSVPSSNKAVAGVSPGIQSSSPSSILHPQSSPLSRRSPGEGGIAITDVTEAEEIGPRGETYIVAKIGLVPRTTAEKNNIEIRVQFFDLDAANQMHPTDAQVTYQWITSDRDWTDPTPKYLVATYLKPHPPRRSREQLHYGGFLVRVYSDGKLQDERSQPETLQTSVRTTPQPPERSIAASPTPLSRQSTAETNVSRPSPSEGGFPTDHSSEAPLPNGIPIPNKPGFVQSPYDPKFLIDVRGFPPGTLVNDPNTNKPFRVP
jgi:hypothetical protein